MGKKCREKQLSVQVSRGFPQVCRNMATFGGTEVFVIKSVALRDCVKVAGQDSDENPLGKNRSNLHGQRKWVDF